MTQVMTKTLMQHRCEEEWPTQALVTQMLREAGAYLSGLDARPME